MTNIIKFKRPVTNLDHSWELNYRHLLSARRAIFNPKGKLTDMIVMQDEKPETVHFLATKEHEKIGCASVIRSELAGNYWRLRMIGVNREFKKNGIGATLMENALNTYKELGSGLWVAVPEKEVGFFEKFGFMEFEHPKNHETVKLITMKLN